MIVEIARAKLNLALHVRARRPDGYHELETLFAFVTDGDVLTVAQTDVPSFTISGPFASALAGETDNLVTRALAAFEAVFGAMPPMAITLEKHLPVASGIGGGSADAAAMLRALARLAGVTDAARLLAIAADLGSDVPACLFGRTAIGRGRGEALTPIEGLGGTPTLLVNPGVGVSTRDVFARWDGVDRGPLGEGALGEVARAARNDLQLPAQEVAAVIAEVLSLLEAQRGATLVRMSGSGATCFALFEDAAAMRAASVAIGAVRPGWWRLETGLA
jgi:4-diphosphocytidyl-2-C-methyl-D-erythritol kinase